MCMQPRGARHQGHQHQHHAQQRVSSGHGDCHGNRDTAPFPRKWPDLWVCADRGCNVNAHRDYKIARRVHPQVDLQSTFRWTFDSSRPQRAPNPSPLPPITLKVKVYL